MKILANGIVGFMKKQYVFIILAITIGVIAGSVFYINREDQPAPKANTQAMDALAGESAGEVAPVPHFVTSSPGNAKVLMMPTSHVDVTSDLELTTSSKMSVTRDNASVVNGSLALSADKRTMTIPIKGDQSGIYKVVYTMCHPDKSCHDGTLDFSIKLSK